MSKLTKHSRNAADEVGVKKTKKIYPVVFDKTLTESQNLNFGWGELMYHAKKHIPGFVIDNNNREAMQQMFLYFMNSPKFKGDLAKGLFAVGAVGSGKSEAFEIFNTWVQGLKLNLWPYGLDFDIASAERIAIDFTDNQNGGGKSLKKYMTKRKWMFDDIGREILNPRHYSTVTNTMQAILEERYRHFKEVGVKTHATSNFPLVKKDSSRPFFDRYGDYIDDRLQQMFNVIIFKGPSRRK